MKARKINKKKAARNKVKKTVKHMKAVKKNIPEKVMKKAAKPAKKQAKEMKHTKKKSTAMVQEKMQKTQRRETKEDINYVELSVRCTECNKEVKIVTLEGSDNSEYLCQKCSSGEFLEEDDEA